MLDIFNDNAFAMTTLTDSLVNAKYVPRTIGAMNLFTTTSVATTSVAIESKDGVLSLVSPTPRGGPGTTVAKSYASLRSLVVPHFEINDAIYAEEVQGIRAFGSETMVDTVAGKVAERLATHADSFAATEEYSRIGAIKGVVTYADSSTLDLFSFFGVSQDAEVDFDLDAASPASGALRKKCASVVRAIQDNLDGIPLGGVHAFCSKEFYDDLIAHSEVRETYLNQMEAPQLRTGYAYGAFEFGGIMWEEYRGSIGGTRFIAADKAHIFPVAPQIFKTYYAPADWVETVNTMGLPRYAKQYAMQNGKGVSLDTQMNSLNICLRPKALIKAKRT